MLNSARCWREICGLLGVIEEIQHPYQYKGYACVSLHLLSVLWRLAAAFSRQGLPPHWNKSSPQLRLLAPLQKAQAIRQQRS